MAKIPLIKGCFMPHSDPHTLVSTTWLAEHLDDTNVRIVDASWYLPTMARDAKVEFAAGHIPGACFVDIDGVSDPNSSLPHMLPSRDDFARHMAAMGIGDAQQVVVYDGAGLFSAARAWWMFKVLGHKAIAVLDGGLPKWNAEQRSVTQELRFFAEQPFTSNASGALTRTSAQVEAAATSDGFEVIDARGAPRFRGEVAEPRAGLRSGHIPNSKNVPFSLVLNSDGTLKNSEDLRLVFEAAGVDLTKPAITTCGSGVTAAILSLALERIGVEHALYDGSWAEWGMDGDLPVATGDA